MKTLAPQPQIRPPPPHPPHHRPHLGPHHEPVQQSRCRLPPHHSHHLEVPTPPPPRARHPPSNAHPTYPSARAPQGDTAADQALPSEAPCPSRTHARETPDAARAATPPLAETGLSPCRAAHRLWLGSFSKFPAKPRSGNRPVPLNRSLGDAQRLRHLVDIQPAEEP